MQDKTPVKIPVHVFADVIKVHPRTVLRQLTGKANATYSRKQNPMYAIGTLARAFGATVEDIEFAVATAGKHTIDTKKACALLGISRPTLIARNYPYLARGDFWIRFCKPELEKFHAANFASDF